MLFTKAKINFIDNIKQQLFAFRPTNITFDLINAFDLILSTKALLP